MKQKFTETHVQYPYAVRNEKLLFDKINFKLLLPRKKERKKEWKKERKKKEKLIGSDKYDRDLQFNSFFQRY